MQRQGGRETNEKEGSGGKGGGEEGEEQYLNWASTHFYRVLA